MDGYGSRKPRRVKPDREFYEEVWTTLRRHANARHNDRNDFVNAMMDGNTEYRFQGWLGFGGKYWRRTNEVSFYPEDLSDLRSAVVMATNAHLTVLKKDRTPIGAVLDL